MRLSVHMYGAILSIFAVFSLKFQCMESLFECIFIYRKERMNI